MYSLKVFPKIFKIEIYTGTKFKNRQFWRERYKRNCQNGENDKAQTTNLRVWPKSRDYCTI